MHFLNKWPHFPHFSALFDPFGRSFFFQQGQLGGGKLPPGAGSQAVIQPKPPHPQPVQAVHPCAVHAEHPLDLVVDPLGEGHPGLEGLAFHRLGPGGLSCREGEVRREGNLLTLIPRNGVPVSGDIGSAEFSRLFADVDRGRYFVRCFVDPDSFEVFVGLRRRFRENGFRLDWIITEEFLLRLVDRADYSASE